ncbi:MAG: hypothetical protein KC493_08995, partial [Bacteriovoracaceae bacterium]|nr:hypothetical protein [Bacteriovoracaceae bacterium]
MKNLKLLMLLSLFISIPRVSPAQVDLDEETTEAQLARYKDTLESYKENDSINMDLQKMEHEKELIRLKAEFAKELKKRDRLIGSQNSQLQKLKNPVYRPIKVQYTG